MKNWSVRNKVFFLGLVPTLLVVVILSGLYIYSQYKEVGNALVERGSALARHLAPASEYGVFSGNETILNSIASSGLKEADVVSISIIDVQNNVLANAGHEHNRDVQYTPEKDARGGISNVNEDSIFFHAPIYQNNLIMDDADDELFEETTDIEVRPNNLLGWFVVELTRIPTKNKQTRLVLKNIVIAICILALTLLMARNIGRSITEPIIALTDAVHKMKNGDLSVTVETQGGRELRTLGTGFNEMSKGLKESQDNLHARVNEATLDLRDAMLQLERKNRELKIERERAFEANQTKSKFLANMSHELRTPLNAIIGYSEMLEEEAEDMGQEGFVKDLGRIKGSGRHLLSLINDVLDISKIEAGKMELYIENFELSELINEVADTIKPLLNASENRLEINIANEVGSMSADMTKLRQILLNLLSNASKFTNKGIVSINIYSKFILNDEWVVIEITDSGIGMTPEQIKKLFTPFTQVDSSTTKKYGGTGLGLTISRHFCQMMGGKINVVSKNHMGSTFAVSLPRYVDNPNPNQASA